KEVADIIGVQFFFIQDYIDGYNNYKPEANLHKIILVINQYNLKMLGIDSSSIDEGSLLKELISKIIIR
ncbi:MAG: DNA polymerase III subunit delta, partial [Sediminibacterium sp.]|nr:DNA polymerase III subunit delta [Sediminibacterium sp.]